MEKERARRPWRYRRGPRRPPERATDEVVPDLAAITAEVAELWLPAEQRPEPDTSPDTSPEPEPGASRHCLRRTMTGACDRCGGPASHVPLTKHGVYCAEHCPVCNVPPEPRS